MTIKERRDRVIKEWRDTWYLMADGDIISYNAIKGMDVVEFYALYEAWRHKMETITNANKKK